MIQIAGGVILNPKLGIAVVNQNNNSWSLPKGHVEPGETYLEAAIREIEEETGIPKSELQLIETLGTYERTQTKLDPNSPDELRSITLFLFTTDRNTLTPRDPENPEALFTPIDRVSLLLTHPEDKKFFESIRSRIYS